MIDDMDDEIELPEPFVNLLNHENIDFDEKEDNIDPTASIINANINDDRRLFQENRLHVLDWDCNIPLEQQPNLSDLYGPKPLKKPDHWYQAEGGISLIYWEENRKVVSICSIVFVNEEDSSFVFRVYGWQGKRKKLFTTTEK